MLSVSTLVCLMPLSLQQVVLLLALDQQHAAGLRVTCIHVWKVIMLHLYSPTACYDIKLLT